jgi:hypothetical protein
VRLPSLYLGPHIEAAVVPFPVQLPLLFQPPPLFQLPLHSTPLHSGGLTESRHDRRSGRAYHGALAKPVARRRAGVALLSGLGHERVRAHDRRAQSLAAFFGAPYQLVAQEIDVVDSGAGTLGYRAD